MLLKKKPEELTPEELAPYASSAMTTVGSAIDFRFFLPRILEIRTSDWGWWPDVEVIFSAMAEAQWTTWPEDEQEAIRNLVRAVVQQFVDSPDDYIVDEVDSWLCAISRAGESAVPYLEEMYSNGHIEKVRQIHEHNANSLMKGRLVNSSWPAPARREVVAWFERADVKDAIVAAYGEIYGAGPGTT